MTAAYTAMAVKGLDGCSIADIIEQAGVGVGSFYNHFSSKEDLAKAVFAERAEELGAALEQAAVTSRNVAAATCYAFRRLIEEVESDPVWAGFIVHLEPSVQMLDNLLRGHARIGLQSGINSGALNIDDLETGITAFNAVIVAVAKSLMEGQITSAQAHRASLLGLRMFGIAQAEAERLSVMSMDDLREALNHPQLI